MNLFEKLFKTEAFKQNEERLKLEKELTARTAILKDQQKWQRHYTPDDVRLEEERSKRIAEIKEGLEHSEPKQ